jgi:chromosome segregation ATPase
MALRITGEEAMALSDAQREANRRRQQAWRIRHQGKPRGNKVLMAELAALRARVAELEAAAAHRTPVVELTTPARQLRAELAALRKERDDLAERLAEIRSYQPGIEAEAKAWLARIDRASRAIGETDDWPENN